MREKEGRPLIIAMTNKITSMIITTTIIITIIMSIYIITTDDMDRLPPLTSPDDCREERPRALLPENISSRLQISAPSSELGMDEATPIDRSGRDAMS